MAGEVVLMDNGCAVWITHPFNWHLSLSVPVSAWVMADGLENAAGRINEYEAARASVEASPYWVPPEQHEPMVFLNPRYDGTLPVFIFKIDNTGTTFFVSRDQEFIQWIAETENH